MRCLVFILALLPFTVLAAEPASGEGSVKLEVFVSPEGTATDAKVVESNNHDFDKAAITVVKKWKFKPRMKDGKAVASKRIQVVKFKMGEAQQGTPGDGPRPAGSARP